MVYDARVKGYKQTFRLLVDTGATANFVSREAVEREMEAWKQQPRESLRKGPTARLANGELIKINEKVTFKLEVLDFQCKTTLNVIDMTPKFDIILGMPWWRKHQPWVNWRRGEIGKTTSSKELAWKSLFHVLLEYGIEDETLLNAATTSVCEHMNEPEELGHRPRRSDLDGVQHDQMKDPKEKREMRGGVTERLPLPLNGKEVQKKTHEVHRVEFPLTAITDLSTVASELTKLEHMEFEDFLTSLQKEEIEEITVITVAVDEPDELNSWRINCRRFERKGIDN